MPNYPMRRERVIRSGGEKKGKQRGALELALQRTAVADGKAALYHAFLELGTDMSVFTASDRALMKVLVQDPDIQARFEEYFRTGAKP